MIFSPEFKDLAVTNENRQTPKYSNSNDSNLKVPRKEKIYFSFRNSHKSTLSNFKIDPIAFISNLYVTKETTKIISNGISQMLYESIWANKSNSNYKKEYKLQKKDKFNSKKEPEIKLNDYIYRIMKYSEIDYSTLLLAIIYLDKVILHKLLITELNVHKIFAISVLIAVKYNEDRYYDNKYYSKTFGLSLDEVNSLETYFLDMINYELFINNDTLKYYFDYFYQKIFVENL